jgi:hypothetical protein
LSTQIRHRNGPRADNANRPGLMDALFSQIAPDTDVDALPLLKALGLVPSFPTTSGTQVYLGV